MHDPGDKEGAPVPDSSNIHFTGQLRPLSKDKISLCNRGKTKTAQGWKAVSMRAEKRSLASKHGHLDSCSAHSCAVQRPLAPGASGHPTEGVPILTLVPRCPSFILAVSLLVWTQREH